ncbi:MFS transporter [Streptomyces sp. L2]|uniref:MFS transporter n=1 Tax=Streptomyces sp. L2 TaxID=2162665 RepID=UPI001012391B|nr:MFS transporter [Streptomyces sp. L2]
MQTTDPPASLLCREVRDRNGRVYRVGESAGELTGRDRIWMAVLPWLGMTGVACAGYAFLAAQDTLGGARPWGGGMLWPAGLWAAALAGAARWSGRRRENGPLSASAAVTAGAFATLLGCLALALAPGVPVVRLGSALVGGTGAGLVHATCLTLPGKWWPERRGGPTAFVASGLVIGAVPFLPGLAGWPAADAGQRTVLAAAGAGACLVVAAAGRLLGDPPKNWWPPHTDPLRAPAARGGLESNLPAVRHYTPEAAVRAPALWLLGLCLLGAAGTTALGLRGLAHHGAGPGAGGGLAWAVVAGGAAAAGAGALSDRLGRRRTLAAACLLLGAAQFGAVAAGRTDGVPLLVCCAAATGLAGVAVLGLVTALAADHFGENHHASVYGLLAGAWLLPAVVVGTGTGADGRDPHGALLLAGCTGLACAVLALFLKAPGRPSARRIVPNPHPLGEEMA